MNTSRNKLLSVLAIILLISGIAMLVNVKPVAAFTDQTHLFVQVSPDPTGVGVATGIVIWTDDPVSTAQVGNSDRYHNYTIQIFGPDGIMVAPVDAFAAQQNCTIDIPLVFDTTGSAFTYFTPTVVGTYTIYANHTNEVIAGNTYLGNHYSDSFTVEQNGPATARDSFPLPQEYWSRPIENQNVFWFSISSNWLNNAKDKNYQGIAMDNFQPDGAASDTPHVMWAQPMTDAVTAARFGGQFPGSHFYNSPPFANKIIMNGNLYYAVPNATDAFGQAAISSPSTTLYQHYNGYYKVVDMRTGNVLNDYFGASTPQWGNYYDADNYNQHGVSPADGTFFADNGTQVANPAGQMRSNDITYNNGSLYVGFQNGTQWIAYRVGNPDGVGDSAFTQWQILNDVPNWGAPAIGIAGEMLYGFVFNAGANITNPTGQNWQVRLWNSSLAGVTETGGATNNASGTTQTSTLTNISASTGGPAVPVTTIGGTQVVLQSNTVAVSLQLTEANYTYRPFTNFYLLCRNGTLPTAGSNATTPGQAAYTYFAISLQIQTINGQTYQPGQIMWMKTFNAPTDGGTILAGPSADGYFSTVEKETGVISVYDMTTGASIFSTPSLTSLTAYPYTVPTSATGCTAAMAYGHLYTAGSSGMVYCYDLATGNLIWGYQTPATTIPGVTNYPANIGLIADDKIYLGSYTLTSTSALYAGATVTCLNAWDGTTVWSMPGWGGAAGYAASDGYMVYVNYYDLNLYCVGRGPSAITVNSAIGGMNKVTITGTITDASPGSALKGQGCISDNSMGAWMNYKYGVQGVTPAATGVDVTISVIDPNGNQYNVGTVTANTDGTYSLDFTPQNPGTYQIIATFAGTHGYYPSFVHSVAYVNTAAQPTATPTPTPVLMTQTYILGSTAAIIIALAIAAVVLALVVRKRIPENNTAK